MDVPQMNASVETRGTFIGSRGPNFSSKRWARSQKMCDCVRSLLIFLRVDLQLKSLLGRLKVTTALVST
jgi:hypothetical protein